MKQQKQAGLENGRLREKYQMFVKPHIEGVSPKTLDTMRRQVRVNSQADPKKWDPKALRENSIMWFLQLLAGPDERVVRKHPRILLTPIYMGMWYDEEMAKYSVDSSSN